jgi:hypothetical protein
LLKSFSAEIYDARPPAAETLSFPFMLNAITEIDLEGIVLPPTRSRVAFCRDAVSA